MRISNFKKRFFCILICFSFLIQSCSIYKKNPVPLNEASDKNIKVKVERNDGTQIFLDRIELTDGVYYGIVKSGGETAKFPLNENSIKTVHILDKTGSTWASLGIGIGLTITFIALFYVIFASGNMTF